MQPRQLRRLLTMELPRWRMGSCNSSSAPTCKAERLSSWLVTEQAFHILENILRRHSPFSCGRGRNLPLDDNAIRPALATASRLWSRPTYDVASLTAISADVR